MKKAFLFLLIIAASSLFARSQNSTALMPQPSLKLNNFIDSASYAYGNVIATSVAKGDIVLNMDLFLKGVTAENSGTSVLTIEQQSELLARLQELANEIQARKIEQIAKENAQKEKDFFAANAQKSGVTQTKSGLQYEQIFKGNASGTTASANDTLIVNYEAKFIDGKLFSSSYETGIPATIPVNQAISGMKEGILLMKPGDSYIFYIPSSLAYGEKGTSEIPPNQGLIFKVDLIRIIKGAAQ